MGACFPVAGLQTELQAAHKESEYVRQKLRHLEEDLGSFRKKNSELTEEVQQKAGKLLKINFPFRSQPIFQVIFTFHSI